MEGILPPAPWIAEAFYLPVPALISRLEHLTIEYCPEQGEFRWRETDSNTYKEFSNADELAVFMQASLFFQTLAAFLACSIKPEHFIRHGRINLYTDSAHDYFAAWRRTISRLPTSARQQIRHVNRALLDFALHNSDLFEQEADSLGESEIFDRVALSVKLLINLLSDISDETLTLIGPAPFGVTATWVQRVGTLFYNYGVCRFDFTGLLRENLSDNPAAMSHASARDYLLRQPNKYRPFLPGVVQGGRAARLLHRIFVAHGWCPYRALQLCRSYDYVLLNSLAALERHVAIRENHTHCLVAQRCEAHTLTVDGTTEYPYAHHNHLPEQACPFIDVPIQELIEILESGDIPLVSLSREGELDLQVTRCTPFVPYTAISHVWSDGMGNPRRNSLPQCQLLRLRRLVAETYGLEHSPFFDDSTTTSILRSSDRWAFGKGSHVKWDRLVDRRRVYFWMDTLCIPASDPEAPERSRDIKFLAMKHITPIFATATNTLVLESELQEMTLAAPRRICGDEVAARILSSKWMQRGWTLEEGALSRDLVFQMAGRPFPMVEALNHALPQAERHHSPIERVNIRRRRMMTTILKRALLEERYLTGSTNKLQRLLRMPQFVWIWNSLLSRSTTKAEDGPLILANLLEFNVSALKTMPSAERLRLLIQSCDELPLSLLYNTSNDRVIDSRCSEIGWIPTAISGELLTTSGSMRLEKRKSSQREPISYVIDRSFCEPSSLLVLQAAPFQYLAVRSEEFIIRLDTSVLSGASREYVIQLHPQSASVVSGHGMQHVQRGSYLFVDLGAGTSSCRGRAAKGVQLFIESKDSESTVLRYGIPLTAWTLDQWSYQSRSSPMDRMVVSQVKISEHLILQCSKNPFISQP
ncbi:hypothetical protein ATETN484_0006063600 [Aspergillus terreus]|nr:hypothetical protein ATETN484_0006063600 [Aspergillus terreus]